MGVNEDASEKDIKKAFRDKSKQFHPDVNPKGEETFKEINEANEILSNPQKRKEYDFKRKNEGMPNFEDFFREYNSYGTTREVFRNLDVRIRYSIGVVDAMTNKEITLMVDRNFECGSCKGEGGETVLCQDCGGAGVKKEVIRNSFMTQVFQRTCERCNGRGKIVNVKCKTCNAKGFLNNKFERKLKVNNITDDQIFIIKNEGNMFGEKRGNILIEFIIEPQSGFYKRGDNLLYRKYLTLNDLKKNNFTVNHPTGELKVPYPKEFNTSKEIEVKGKGFKSEGSLFIKYDVRFERND